LNEAVSTLSKTPPYFNNGTSDQAHSANFPEFLKSKSESRFNFARSEGPAMKSQQDPDEIILPA
jgi:hypothetical protein